ncbi:IPT/TIG domain-containing protein [Psychrobacillus sp. FSL K6-4615]|uniref:IPT/TIG domain-containing protein n=1 Tax=Psychrobacillus sp. FSL K6-4615 TaxID=2921551 RepID=UPI0030FC5A4C
MKILKFIKLALIAILIIGIATPLSTEAATVKSGDLMNINKTVSNSTLVKGETTDVTLTVKGTPQDSTFVKPNDVILIIDKSGSMQSDNRLNAAKLAAKEFIDLMDLTKHELGIVDFSDRASSFALTTDQNAAKAYVDTIQLGGGTNTSDAIRTATTMLATKRSEAQPTIVIMTDGEANSSTDALAAAKAAKAAGITFYSIALLGPNDNPDTSAPNKLLKEMASSFDHHHFVLGSVGLSDVYKAIVEEIGLASAYNVTITDKISPEFELVPGSYDNHIPRPTVNGNTISWFISELKTDELSFTYQVRAKDSATAGKYTLAQTSSTFEIGDGSTYSLNTTNPIIEIKNHAPVITNITKDKGLTSGGETVTITGQNFLPGAKVYFGTVLGTVTSFTTNEIIVTTPVGTQGTVVLKVENTDRQFAIGSFNYYAIPTITAVSPAEGPFLGGNTVTISGTNFLKGAVVYFNDVPATTTFSSNILLRATAPEATASGVVTVKVVNPDQTSGELIDSYTYLEKPTPPAVEIISLSLTSGELQGGTTLIVTGKNFDRNVQIYFGDTVASTTFVSSTSVRVTVPAATTPGAVPVKAENPDGISAVLTNAFEYLAPAPLPVPEITSLSVDTILVGNTQNTIVYGKNFNKTTKVFIGKEQSKVTYLTATTLRATIPVSNVAGAVDVKVENDEGQGSMLVDGFTYTEPVLDPAPIITTLSSNAGSTAGNDTITITGDNFKTGAKVYFGDRLATITSISATEITVKTPSALNKGLVSVKVINSDLQEGILQDSFTYEGIKPTVTRISLDNGSVKGGYNTVVYGTNFASNITVTVGGKPTTVKYLSATQLRVTIPSGAAPGVVQIVVDLGGETDSISFTYN